MEAVLVADTNAKFHNTGSENTRLAPLRSDEIT